MHRKRKGTTEVYLRENCGFIVSNNLAEGLKSVICHIGYQNKYITSKFRLGWNSLRFIPLTDRCVIARDALGRLPAAAASPVSADGLKLSTWLVWPTRRTWRIREVDMVNQWTWPRCTAHRCGPRFGWLQRQRFRLWVTLVKQQTRASMHIYPFNCFPIECLRDQ